MSFFRNKARRALFVVLIALTAVSIGIVFQYPLFRGKIKSVDNRWDGTITIEFRDNVPLSDAQVRQIASSVSGTIMYSDLSSSSFPAMVIRPAIGTDYQKALDLSQTIERAPGVLSAFPSPKLSAD